MSLTKLAGDEQKNSFKRRGWQGLVNHPSEFLTREQCNLVVTNMKRVIHKQKE